MSTAADQEFLDSMCAALAQLIEQSAANLHTPLLKWYLENTPEPTNGAEQCRYRMLTVLADYLHKRDANER